MRLVDVLRGLALRGVGLAPEPGGLGIYPSPYGAAGPTLTPALRVGVGQCKAALLRLADVASVRRAWLIPDETPLSPQLSTMLAWLLVERTTFSAEQHRTWLDRVKHHEAEGSSYYVAKIFATHDIACESLRPGVAAANETQSDA